MTQNAASDTKPRSHTGRLLSRLLIILTVTALAGGAYWFYREQSALLLFAINRATAPYQIEVLAIDGLIPGIRSTRIGSLHLRHADTHANISINNLRVSYQGAELLNGRVRDLRADRAEITINDPSTPFLSGVYSAADGPAQHTAMALLPSLPFESLTINTLELSVTHVDMSAVITASLRLNTSPISTELLDLASGDAALNYTAMSVMGVSAQGVQVQVAGLQLSCDKSWVCHAEFSTTGNIESARNAEHQLSGLQWQMPLFAEYSAQQTRIALQKSARLTLEQWTAGAYEAGLVEFNIGDHLTLTRQIDTPWAIHLAGVTAELPLLRTPQGMAGSNLTINEATLSYPDFATPLELSRLSVDANFSISSLYTNMLSLNLWNMVFDQSLSLHSGQLNLNLLISAAGHDLLQADIQHHLGNRRGNGHFTIPVQHFSDQRKLTSILQPLPVNTDLIDGELSVNAELDWDLAAAEKAVVTGPVSLRAHALSGYLNDTAFAGLSAILDVELLTGNHLRTRHPGFLTLVRLDPGITLFDMSSLITFDTRDGRLILERPEAGVFGGRIGSERVDYNLTSQQGELRLFLTGIDISQIMSLSAYDAVSATGRINGILPVTLNNMLPLVSDGILYASPPGGTIRYGGSNPNSGNVSMDLVYQALAQYNYQLLEAGVNYLDNGELLLAIRMEGISPQLNSGQRINLNLNISDNIPSLLNSLQATRQVTDRLTEQMQDAF